MSHFVGCRLLKTSSGWQLNLAVYCCHKRCSRFAVYSYVKVTASGLCRLNNLLSHLTNSSASSFAFALALVGVGTLILLLLIFELVESRAKNVESNPANDGYKQSGDDEYSIIPASGQLQMQQN